METLRDAANALIKRLSGLPLEFKAASLTQLQMVVQLNRLGINAARGGEWSLAQVLQVLKQLEEN